MYNGYRSGTIILSITWARRCQMIAIKDWLLTKPPSLHSRPGMPTAKVANSLSLLVVLQVGQDPTRRSQNGQGEQTQSNDSFLGAEKISLSNMRRALIYVS